MDIIITLLQYLMFVCEGFIYWRIMQGALGPKYNKNYLIIAAVCMPVLLASKKIIFDLPGMRGYLAIGTLVIMLYTFLAIILLCEKTFLEKLIWGFVHILGSGIMEILPLLIIHAVLNKSMIDLYTDRNSFYIMFIFKFMQIFIIEIIIRKRKGSLLIGDAYLKELFVITLWDLVLLVSTVYIFSNKNSVILNIDNVIFVIFCIVLLITIYLVILILRLEKKSKEELETQLKLQQIELELKLNNDMIDVTDKLRKLRHDMNNHIGLIKALVRTKKYDDLEEYINQIYEDVEIANELVITGNKTLSVLINSKKNLAKSKNIDFSSMVTTQDFKMQNKDICALLGNILDNAIEAAEKSGSKKYIQLMIQKTEEGCIISCENSIGMKPIVKKGKFITIKENTLLHGIGISNIKDIVTKYKGEINFDYDDEMFQVKVIMPV